MMYPPDLDAVGGRSYKQSSQTAGALGGRRDVVQWHPTGGGIDLLVMIQSNVGGSPSTFKRKTAQLVEGVWTLVEDEASVSQYNLNVLKRLGGNLYRIRARRDNNNLFVRGAVGGLERSSDGGATWADVGPAGLTDDDGQEWGVSDIDIGADGSLWLCAGPTAHNQADILASTVASPTELDTFANHGLTTGDEIIITDHTSDTPKLDNHEAGNPETWTVTVTGAKTFTIPVAVTNGGSGGQVTLPPFRAAVYKSTPASNGAVWTAVYKDAMLSNDSGFADLYCGIACHPSDKDIIVVVANSGSGIGRILHTLDQGATDFTENKPGAMNQSSGSGRKIAIWDNGRVFVFVGNISDAGMYTDDYGATDVTVSGLAAAIDNGQFFYDFVALPSGLMFVLGGSSLNPQVVRTKDYGATWENIFDGGTDFVNNFGVMTGLAYDSVNDTLYMASAATSSSSGALPRVRALDQASQVLVADVGSQTWRDLQFNLDSVFDDSIGHAGIALL